MHENQSHMQVVFSSFCLLGRRWRRMGGHRLWINVTGVSRQKKQMACISASAYISSTPHVYFLTPMFVLAPEYRGPHAWYGDHNILRPARLTVDPAGPAQSKSVWLVHWTTSKCKRRTARTMVLVTAFALLSFQKGSHTYSEQCHSSGSRSCWA